MRAVQPSEAIALCPRKFSDTFHLHPKPWYMARNYGVSFVKYMNEIELTALTDVMFDAQVWRGVVKASDTFVLARKSMMASHMPPPGAMMPISEMAAESMGQDKDRKEPIRIEIAGASKGVGKGSDADSDEEVTR